MVRPGIAHLIQLSNHTPSKFTRTKRGIHGLLCPFDALLDMCDSRRHKHVTIQHNKILQGRACHVLISKLYELDG